MAGRDHQTFRPRNLADHRHTVRRARPVARPLCGDGRLVNAMKVWPRRASEIFEPRTSPRPTVSGDFQRAGESQAIKHRSEGDECLAKHAAHLGNRRKAGEIAVIPAGGLEGNVQSDGGGERARPGTRSQYHTIGLNDLTRCEDHTGDPLVGHQQSFDAALKRALSNLDALFLQPVAKRLREGERVHGRALVKTDGPGHRIAKGGIASAQGITIEAFRGVSEGREMFDLLLSIVQTRWLQADVEPTTGAPVAVDRGVGTHLVEAAGGLPSQVGEHRKARFKVRLIAVSMEGQQPASEIAVEARLDVERAIPIEHPLQSLHAHAGPGEGGMPVDDEPGVSATRAVANGFLVEYDAGDPTLVQRPRTREADDAAADDDHGLFCSGHDAGW